MAGRDPACKGKTEKWIYHERRFSNLLWHAGYKRLPDKRRSICRMDDASRFLVRFGVFEEQTTANAIRVPEQGIQKRGRPARVLTGHGPYSFTQTKKRMRRGPGVNLRSLSGLASGVLWRA